MQIHTEVSLAAKFITVRSKLIVFGRNRHFDKNIGALENYIFAEEPQEVTREAFAR